MQNENQPPAESDDPWDAFLVDDDQLDPLPEPGDFWIDGDYSDSGYALESEGF